MATFSTAVRMMSISASSCSAMHSEAKSLSMTAGTPLRWYLSSHTTGIPPPPAAITACFAFISALTVAISTISFGRGLATT